MIYTYIVRVFSALIPVRRYRRNFRNYMLNISKQQCYKRFMKSCMVESSVLKFENTYISEIGLSTKEIGKLIIFRKGRLCDLDVRVSPFCVIERNSSIGNYSYINARSTIWSGTEIGRYCSISSGCSIGAPRHNMEWLTTMPLEDIGEHPKYCENKIQRTIISNDVWIGANAVIKAGLHIGNGAVIGAGAVVTKDVPDYAIVAGVPAKIIRYRFDQEQIHKLLDTKWWELEPETIRTLTYQNINKCLVELQVLKNK